MTKPSERGTPDLESMLTIKEAAEVWNVSPKTVWRMIQRKELEAERVGRQWRIRPRQVRGRGS